MIFSSVSLGMSFADSWVMKQGGAVDTDTYHIVLKSYQTSFLVAGGILFSFGLLLGTVASVRLRFILNEENESESISN